MALLCSVSGLTLSFLAVRAIPKNTMKELMLRTFQCFSSKAKSINVIFNFYSYVLIILFTSFQQLEN